MSRLFKVQSRIALVAYCAVVCGLVVTTPAQASRNAKSLNMSGDASRMVFKENKKNNKEPSCQLTLMHVYTSKFNKKHTQFAFTGSVVAKREKGKDMVLTVVGQNHELNPLGKDFKPFALQRIELGVEDTSVRRLSEHKHKCKELNERRLNLKKEAATAVFEEEEEPAVEETVKTGKKAKVN